MDLPHVEELQKMIADPKKKKSARTVQLTISNLRRLQDREYDFADPEKVAARLREAHKPSTARTYISALINYLSASGKDPAALKEYRKELVRLEKEIGIDYHRAAFTDRQKEQLVKWEDILAHRDALEPDVNNMAAPLKGRALKKMYDHLLLSFYTHMPPGRNEYRMLRIVDEPPKGKGSKEENFYVKGEDGDQLILHRYKTAKHYGSARVPLPADLQKSGPRIPGAAPPGVCLCKFCQTRHTLDHTVHEQSHGCRVARQETWQCAAAQDCHHRVCQAREGKQGGACKGDAQQAGDQRAVLQQPGQGRG